MRHLLEDIFPKNTQFQEFEVSHNFPNIGEKVMMLNARKVVQRSHRREMLLLAIEDITGHRRAQRFVEEREAWLRNMADNAPGIIWVANADGRFNFLNKTGQDYLGSAIADELRQTWAGRIHPEDRAEYERIHTEGMTRHQPYRAQYRLQRHDGEYRWMLEDGKPLLDPDGTHTGYLSTAAEIHDQKVQAEELERRVAERTQALRDVNTTLERSNENLRQYAYVASHDLQEPLRKIVTFSKRLDKKDAEALSDQGREYLGKITDSALRMTQLIDDLLVFSRTTRQDQAFVPTDLNVILKDVLRDFDLVIAETDATIEADPLPTLDALPLQMAQLFHNLLSNALKFRAPGRPTVIRITARRPASADLARRLPQSDPAAWWEIVVQDNGIGLNPVFSEQIFLIFQRLHDKSAYTGTGIGLALCRRIATNHGGDLFANAEEGQGAAFHVLLPTKQTAA